MKTFLCYSLTFVAGMITGMMLLWSALLTRIRQVTGERDE